jgi:hypothetical protein
MAKHVLTSMNVLTVPVILKPHVKILVQVTHVNVILVTMVVDSTAETSTSVTQVATPVTLMLDAITTLVVTHVVATVDMLEMALSAVMLMNVSRRPTFVEPTPSVPITLAVIAAHVILDIKCLMKDVLISTNVLAPTTVVSDHPVATLSDPTNARAMLALAKMAINVAIMTNAAVDHIPATAQPFVPTLQAHITANVEKAGKATDSAATTLTKPKRQGTHVRTKHTARKSTAKSNVFVWAVIPELDWFATMTTSAPTTPTHVQAMASVPTPRVITAANVTPATPVMALTALILTNVNVKAINARQTPAVPIMSARINAVATTVSAVTEPYVQILMNALLELILAQATQDVSILEVASTASATLDTLETAMNVPTTMNA